VNGVTPGLHEMEGASPLQYQDRRFWRLEFEISFFFKKKNIYYYYYYFKKKLEMQRLVVNAEDDDRKLARVGGGRL
jgi:hypothetical protein